MDISGRMHSPPLTVIGNSADSDRSMGMALSTWQVIWRLGLLAFVLLTALMMACKQPTDTAVKFSTHAKMPFGFVDNPQPGQALRGTAQLGGWALAEGGIQEVAIYLDRNFVIFATLGGARPDVAKAYPSLPGSESAGWNVILNTAAIPAGTHELTVQAHSKDGACRDLGTVAVSIVR
jgi:hypothetical protein